jgi:hypothetical protein
MRYLEALEVEMRALLLLHLACVAYAVACVAYEVPGGVGGGDEVSGGVGGGV